METTKKPIAKKPIKKKVITTSKKPVSKGVKKPIKQLPKQPVKEPIKIAVKPIENNQKKPVEKATSEFSKQEEKIQKIDLNNSQKTGNQGDSVLSDFFNTPTENSSKIEAEEMHENPAFEKTNTTSSNGDPEKAITGDGESINAAHSGHADFNEWGAREGEKKDDEGLEMDASGDSFFDDEEAVAEFMLEIMDMALGGGASFIAKDLGNPDEHKWSLSDNRKKKLRKPLQMILKQRNIQMKPEWAFGGMLLGVYAPMMITAFAERNAKKVKEEEAQRKERNLQVLAKREKDSLPKTEGRTPICQRCKIDVPNCKCEEGPKLSAYMKSKMGN
jgi:hypothetical protein